MQRKICTSVSIVLSITRQNRSDWWHSCNDSLALLQSTEFKKGSGEKTLQFGAICDKERHIYGLCIKTSNPADPRMRPFDVRIYGDAFYEPASGLSLRRYELPEKSKTIWNRLCWIQTAANNLHCNVSTSYFKKLFLRKICCSLIHEQTFAMAYTLKISIFGISHFSTELQWW